MRFLSSLILVIIFTTGAWAQTAEETAAAAANAAFSVLEESLISEFFKSTGLEPKELEVLGDIVDIITGGESTTDINDDGNGNGNGQGNSKKNKKGSGGLPPGLAKRDALPPGLAKHLEKYGTLPPGLEVRGLPEALSKQLPNPGAGRKRVVVDDDILLIETQTGRILDILKDVIGAGN